MKRCEDVAAVQGSLATPLVVDHEKRFVTGQNQNSGLEAAHMMMAVIADRQ